MSTLLGRIGSDTERHRSVKCITIEGENAIIAADQFDWLCSQAKRAAELERAAREVVKWDWSENDADCVADIERLRNAVDAP